MTHNTKEVVTKLEKKKRKKTATKKNNTINLVLILNYYEASHKNRGQEQQGFRDT